MAPPTIYDETAQDDSSSDEDFNPEAQAAEVESSSSDDDEGASTALSTKKRGTKRARDDDGDDAELDSGDEATIQEPKKQKRRKKKKGVLEDYDGGDFLSDDEGGAGGFVRTRAQRRTEKVERRALASTKGATIDVDDVWSRLAAIPIGRAVEATPATHDEEYITIKRTTKFAGQVSTEEKRVLKSSKEARIWLEEQEAAEAKKKATTKNKENEAPQDEEAQPHNGAEGEITRKMPLRRPLKRPLKWDPNPTGEVKGLPQTLQLRWPRDKVLAAPAVQPVANAIPNHRMLPPPLPGAAKLTTVQKSKYDWASYVDKNKLAEELDEYGRSKQSYAGRTDFLSRIESRKEEQRLAAARSGR